jgi:putative phage-type endonuclease
MKSLTYDEWHSWRESGITGSEAPIIMGKSPWATPLDLFMRRTGRKPPQEMTYPMRRGLKLEPEARALYEAMYQVEVPARLLVCKEWEIARASFDGLNEQIEHSIEIKCPGKDDHLLALKGVIPEKYLYQLVHQCMVSGYDALDYVSYHPEFPAPFQLARVVFVRDLKLEAALLAKEKEFWQCLLTDTPPGQKQPFSEPQAEQKPTRALLPPGASETKKSFDFPVRQKPIRKPAKPTLKNVFKLHVGKGGDQQ